MTENSLKECQSTPYKRRKQTGQALEALNQLFQDSFTDEQEGNKFNKNDILSLTLARLLRCKYWSSTILNRSLNFIFIDSMKWFVLFFFKGNVQLSTGIQSSSINDDLTGFIVVVNAAGRIILLSDNVEYYLRKNVVRILIYPLTSFSLSRCFASVHYILNWQIFTIVWVKKIMTQFIKCFQHQLWMKNKRFVLGYYLEANDLIDHMPKQK